MNVASGLRRFRVGTVVSRQTCAPPKAPKAVWDRILSAVQGGAEPERGTSAKLHFAPRITFD